MKTVKIIAAVILIIIFGIIIGYTQYNLFMDGYDMSPSEFKLAEMKTGFLTFFYLIPIFIGLHYLTKGIKDE